MQEIKSIQEFNALVNQDKPVLLDFYAEWCGPCKAMMPVVEDLADKYEKDIAVAKINVDVQQAIAQKFDVRSIPTLFFVHQLKIKERLLGMQSATDLEAKIKQYSQLSN